MNETPANSQTVLVVEDQEETALLITYLVKSAGYQHKYASNGQEALDLLNDGLRPDLILLDAMMPVMGGYELLEELQKDESLKEIPVVMLTSLDEASDVLTAVKKGAVDYCTKPVDPDDLLATIQRFI